MLFPPISQFPTVLGKASFDIEKKMTLASKNRSLPMVQNYFYIFCGTTAISPSTFSLKYVNVSGTNQDGDIGRWAIFDLQASGIFPSFFFFNKLV